MSNKEDRAKECVEKVIKEQYNSHLDSDDIMKAFNIGWDAAINKFCEFIQTNVRKYHKSGVFHVAEFIKDLRKYMEE